MRILITCIFCLVAVSSVQATTYYVTDDYLTIQAAIDDAENGDVIRVRPGTYMENINFLSKDITVESTMGPFLTFIDGNKSGSVVTITGQNCTDAILEGFTIANGSGNPSYNGCGILIDYASPTIRGNIIQNNGPLSVGSGYGGGIFCSGDQHNKNTITIEGNTISGNGHTSFGGGIYVQHSICHINGNTITNNKASGGGGVMSHYKGEVYLIDNTIESNDSVLDAAGVCYTGESSGEIRSNQINYNSGGQNGGGIYLNTSEPKIIDNTIKGNYAQNRGGGIVCVNASPDILSNTIDDNETSGFGGGIHCINIALPLVFDNTITNNRASSGGGIGCGGNGPISALVLGNRIQDNYATVRGGGIYVSGVDTMIRNNLITDNTAADSVGGGIDVHLGAHVELHSNTVANNEVTQGKGGGISVYDTSTVIARHCIFWSNSASTGPQMQVAGSSTMDIAWSCVEGGQSGVNVEATATLIWGPGMIDTDPLFVQGYHLSPMSPCVNGGDPEAQLISCSTGTDGHQDRGILDIGYHDGPYHIFEADTYTVPGSSGGTANLTIGSGEAKAFRNYLILGSVTGTDPGTPLPGGSCILPLNWDAFTGMVILLLNSPYFSDFTGQLDNEGKADASFNLPGGVITGPLDLYFAYTLDAPWESVSNPVRIRIQ